MNINNMLVDRTKENEQLFGDLRQMVKDGVIHTLYAEAKHMRDLLHLVNEATGPGAHPQQLPDALEAVSDYLDTTKE